MHATENETAFRPALAALVPYEPGRPIELVRRELGLSGPVVKLASNEGARGPLPGALAAIQRAAAEGNRYPDSGCYELREALARKHGVAFEQVVVGNGADAVLNYLALAMLEPGDEVACCWPSFPVYVIDAAKMGATAARAPLAGSAYDLDALLAAVTPRTRIAYVTNPNNPTGGMVTREALAAFLDALPGHVLPVLDEAYFEYVDDPAYPDGIREHVLAGRRLVVLRTFSKIYGLAGLRVGYGIAPVDVAAACGKVRNTFDVPQLAQAAALASLDDPAEIAARRAENSANRGRLVAGLRRLGYEPLPSVANFVCVPVGDGAALAARLERLGVIVRPLASFGDPTSVRISVGLEAEVDACLQALADAAA
jgi:histidinol-phosphate aminotransferase